MDNSSLLFLSKASFWVKSAAVKAEQLPLTNECCYGNEEITLVLRIARTYSIM